MATSTPIESAQNVGPVLARELRRVGITTLEELRRQGYFAAWEKLRAADPQRHCVMSCLALAGAVEGVPWKQLPGVICQGIKDEVEAVNRAQ